MPSCDPAQLLQDGRCFAALSDNQLMTVIAQLTCDVAQSLSGGGGGGGFIPRVGADVATTTIPYSSSLVVDFDGPAQQEVTATGNMTISMANAGVGKFVSLCIIPSPGPITITLGAGIKKSDNFDSVVPLNKIVWLTFIGRSAGVDCVYQIFS